MILRSTVLALLFLLAAPSRAAEVGVAGTPELAGLAARRDAGLALVVDLRTAAEDPATERAAAEALGLRYVNLPVDGDPADPAVVRRFSELLASVPEGQGVLLHCRSGNRAGEVWARHRLARGASLEEALAEGFAAGLSESRAAYVRAAAGVAETEAPSSMP
jgi:uncharacterized protein (TIGR01244 family)